MTYSVTVMRSLVKYAQERAIVVVPEYDSPGHAAPEIPQHLVKCTEPENSLARYGLQSPVAQYNIEPANIETTARWFAQVWKKTRSIFPSMPFLHFGGDEVNVPCMVLGTEFENLTNEEAKVEVDRWQSDWAFRMQSIARDLNLPAAMWQDGYLNHEAVEVENSTILQLWDFNSANEKHKERLLAACQTGTKLIQSRFKSYYLDCGGANWQIGGDTTWCEYVGWHRIYMESLTWDLPEECLSNVIGGSVNIWTEMINDHNLLTKAFPRAWAMAERLWSAYEPYAETPPLTQTWDPTFAKDKMWAIPQDAQAIWIPFLKRLRLFQNNQDQEGLPSQPLQTQACVVNPELCDTWTASFR